MIENKYLIKIFKASPLPSLILLTNAPHFSIKAVNSSYLKVTGTKEEDLIGKGIFEIFPTINNNADETDFSSLLVTLNTVIDSKLPNKMATHQFKFTNNLDKKTEIKYWDITNTPIIDNIDNVGLILLSINDVTESQYYNLLEKLEREILEKNAQHEKGLSDLISEYLLGIEALHPSMICSMQELKGDQLYNLASPSLPAAFINKVSGITIGNNVGSCGTAAYLKEIVIVSDISTDIRWKDLTEITEQCEFKACWSSPILDSKGMVMATFANYYKEIKTPTPLEQNTIKRAGNILKIILENHRKNELIKESEARYRNLIELSPEPIFVSCEDKIVYVNPATTKMFGVTSSDEIVGKSIKDFIHQDYSQSVIERINGILNGIIDEQIGESKLLKFDGTIIDIEAQGIAIDYNGKAAIQISMRDVTKRKQAEKEMLLSNERYDLVAKATSDSIWDWNIVTNEVIRLGEGFKTLFGYESEQANNDNSFWQTIVHTDDLPWVSESIFKALQNPNEHYWEKEFRIKKACGDYTYVVDKGYIIRNEKGEAIRMIGATQSVDSRKKAEIALIENLKVLEDYKFALDQSAIIGMTDQNGVILTVNNNFCEISEYTREELIGKTHTLIDSNFHFDDFFKDMWLTITAGKVWRGEIKNKSKSGKFYWVNATIIPFLDQHKKPFQYLSVQFDVTERKNAEDAILLSNERYNLVAKATNDSIWDWNLISGEINRTGEGFKTLFGYEIEKIGISRLNWTNLIHPEDLSRVKESLELVFNNPTNYYWEQDFRFLKANGQHAFVNDKGFIIRDNDGKAIRMIGATQDITERVKHLNAIELQNKKLREIAWTQSHIARAPLSRMMGIVSLLKEMVNDSPEFNEWVQHFVNSSQELDGLIHEITAKSEEIDLNS